MGPRVTESNSSKKAVSSEKVKYANTTLKVDEKKVDKTVKDNKKKARKDNIKKSWKKNRYHLKEYELKIEDKND